MTITELRPDRAATAPDLHAAFVARRAADPANERLLDIVVEVLARADRAGDPGHRADATAWDRLLRLLDDQREAPHGPAACAASANLVGLAVYGDPADHAALADLARLLGHERLALLQDGHGRRLEPDASLPVTTAVVRRLLAGGTDVGRRAAYALLLQGVDRTGAPPPLESVEELLDIVHNGSVSEWRHLMGLALESAWSPYAVRLAELATEAGLADAAATIRALIDVCREQQQRAERDAVAREIGRLVASSGVPAPEFAAWMGTTPDRLSTYTSGAVTPSAAVLVRISRTSRALQRRASLDAAVRGRRLLSVPGGATGAGG